MVRHASLEDIRFRKWAWPSIDSVDPSHRVFQVWCFSHIWFWSYSLSKVKFRQLFLENFYVLSDADIQQHLSVPEAAATMRIMGIAAGSWNFSMLLKACWELPQRSNIERRPIVHKTREKRQTWNAQWGIHTIDGGSHLLPVPYVFCASASDYSWWSIIDGLLYWPIQIPIPQPLFQINNVDLYL